MWVGAPDATCEMKADPACKRLPTFTGHGPPGRRHPQRHVLGFGGGRKTMKEILAILARTETLYKLSWQGEWVLSQ